jgi:serine protease
MRNAGWLSLSLPRSLGVVALTVSALGMWAHWNRGPTDRHTPTAAAVSDIEAAEASTFDLLVDYRDDIGQDVLAATPWTEEPVSDLSRLDQLHRIQFDNLSDAQQAAAALRANPAVESVDWDVPATLLPQDLESEALAQADRPSVDCAAEAGTDHAGFPNDPCYQYQWHLRQVGLPGAWKLGQGQGVTVAVIDTGVTAVPDLAGIELVAGYNFVGNNKDARDDHGHGTHVAGTIAQATNNKLGVAGVAFGAKIMPLKVLSAQGSGSMGAISQAIRYAADNGAQVINMSLGGPFPTAAIRKAVAYARSKGTFVVAAAGNDGKGRVGYPAKYPEVFAVAATQFDETTTFYSNWGAEVDIAAPGGNVRVDQNGDGKPDGVLQNTVTPGNIAKVDYLWFMGTSMASPHVAGVAALVAGAGVNKPDALDAILRSTARAPKARSRDLAATGDNGSPTADRTVESSGRVDDHYGAGIVDAGAALRKARVDRGVGSLALAGSLGLLGLAGLRRRGQLAALGVGMPAAAAVSAGGLFFVPWAWLAGSPLLLSAALPLAGVAVLAGIRRARPWVGGLAFGLAGALAVLAITASVDVSFVPDVLDRLWLTVNAAACVVLGRSILRK